MWMHTVRAAVAASLWVIATALMIGATFGGKSVLVGWSILFALWGSILVGWHLLVMERARTESIARLAARTALDHGRLESVE